MSARRAPLWLFGLVASAAVAVLIYNTRRERWDARPATVAEALAVELKTMASWLGLEAVGVERRGNLARPLAAAVRE